MNKVKINFLISLFLVIFSNVFAADLNNQHINTFFENSWEEDLGISDTTFTASSSGLIGTNKSIRILPNTSIKSETGLSFKIGEFQTLNVQNLSNQDSDVNDNYLVTIDEYSEIININGTDKNVNSFEFELPQNSLSHDLIQMVLNFSFRVNNNNWNAFYIELLNGDQVIFNKEYSNLSNYDYGVWLTEKVFLSLANSNVNSNYKIRFLIDGDHNSVSFKDFFLGTRNSLPPSNWDQLFYDDFENASGTSGPYGNWIDGGGDCKLYSTNQDYIFEGAKGLLVRDDSDSSYTSLLSPIDLINNEYKQIRVDFGYVSKGIKQTRGFYLEYSNNGLDWDLVKEYNVGVDYEDLEKKESTVYFNSNDFDFNTNQGYLRFRVNGNDDGDWVILDNILISATQNSAPSIQNQNLPYAFVNKNYNINLNNIFIDSEELNYQILDSSSQAILIDSNNRLSANFGPESLGMQWLIVRVSDNSSYYDFPLNLIVKPEDNPEWFTLLSDDFSDGLGNYQKYEGNVKHSADLKAVSIESTSNAASMVLSNGVDLTKFVQLKIEYDHKASNFESGDKYHLEIWDNINQTWSLVKEFRYNIDFVNSSKNSTDGFTRKSIVLNRDQFSFTDNFNIRFKHFGDEVVGSRGSTTPDYDYLRIDNLSLTVTENHKPEFVTSYVDPIIQGSYSANQSDLTTTVRDQDIVDGYTPEQLNFELIYGPSFIDILPNGTLQVYSDSAKKPDQKYASEPGLHNIKVRVTDIALNSIEYNVSLTILAGQDKVWTPLLNEDFADLEGNQDFGDYVSTGSDSFLYTDAQGNTMVQLRDDTSSSIIELEGSIDLDTPGYRQLMITFDYVTSGFENSDKFHLEYWDGVQWLTLKTYVPNVDFLVTETNWYSTSTSIIESEIYIFPTDARIRFRMDGSDNGDILSLDNIIINTTSYEPPQQLSSVLANGVKDNDYYGSLAGAVELPGYDESLYFRRVIDPLTLQPVGPSWLNVSSQGILSSNTPPDKIGSHTFLIEANNRADFTGTSLLFYASIIIEEGNAFEEVVLLSDDFDDSLGSWKSTGTHSFLSSESSFDGGAAQIRKTSDSSAIELISTIDLAMYSEFSLQLDFKSISFSAGKYFTLDLWDGQQWSTVKKFIAGTQPSNFNSDEIYFDNNVYHRKSVTIHAPQVGFASNSKVRLMCYGAMNYDRVYIDNVKLTTKQLRPGFNHEDFNSEDLILFSDSFDGGVGNWNSTGSNSFLSSESSFIGNTLQIRKTSETSAVELRDVPDLSGYEQLDVSFDFKSIHFGATRYFTFDVWDGEFWTTIREFRAATAPDEHPQNIVYFKNNQKTTSTFTILNSEFPLANILNIRFMCYGASDYDRVHLDNINISVPYPDNIYKVQFRSGEAGYLSGETKQLIKHGSSSTIVTAIPNENAEFLRWSDGSTEQSRTFSRLTQNIDLTAEFINTIDSIEIGQIEIDSNEITVPFKKSYLNPVVILGSSSNNDVASGFAQLGSVNSDSFNLKFTEFDYSSHGIETCFYMVLEAGLYKLPSGGYLEAGIKVIKGEDSQIHLKLPFVEPPLVLMSPSIDYYSYNQYPFSLSADNVTNNSLNVKTQMIASHDKSHIYAHIPYVAITKKQHHFYVNEFKFNVYSNSFDSGSLNLNNANEEVPVDFVFADLKGINSTLRHDFSDHRNKLLKYGTSEATINYFTVHEATEPTMIGDELEIPGSLLKSTKETLNLDFAFHGEEIQDDQVQLYRVNSNGVLVEVDQDQYKVEVNNVALALKIASPGRYDYKIVINNTHGSLEKKFGFTVVEDSKEDHLFQSYIDQYGRITYFLASESDTNLRRIIQGITPEYRLTDDQTGWDLNRDDSEQPLYLIYDYTVDDNGNTISVTDVNGLTHDYHYDDELLQVYTFAQGTNIEEQTNYTYDSHENLITTDTNKGYLELREYTDPNHPQLLTKYTRKEGSEGQETETFSETFSYDNQGNITHYSNTSEKNNNYQKQWQGSLLVAEKTLEGKSFIYNYNSDSQIVHQIEVSDLANHSNFNDPLNSDTLEEITKTYDEQGRVMTETKWNAPLGIVNPNSLPTLTNTDDAQITTYLYYDEINDPAKLIENEQLDFELTGLFEHLIESNELITGRILLKKVGTDTVLFQAYDSYDRLVIDGELDPETFELISWTDYPHDFISYEAFLVSAKVDDYKLQMAETLFRNIGQQSFQIEIQPQIDSLEIDPEVLDLGIEAVQTEEEEEEHPFSSLEVIEEEEEEVIEEVTYLNKNRVILDGVITLDSGISYVLEKIINEQNDIIKLYTGKSKKVSYKNCLVQGANKLTIYYEQQDSGEEIIFTRLVYLDTEKPKFEPGFLPKNRSFIDSFAIDKTLLSEQNVDLGDDGLPLDDHFSYTLYDLNLKQKDRIISYHGEALPDGYYTLKVSVTDKAGKVNNITSRNFTVDSTLPDLSDLTLAEKSTSNDISEIHINEENMLVGNIIEQNFQSLNIKNITDDNSEITTTKMAYTYKGLLNGPNELLITVLDKAGNKSVREITVFKDTADPGINSETSSIFPSNGDIISEFYYNVDEEYLDVDDVIVTAWNLVDDEPVDATEFTKLTQNEVYTVDESGDYKITMYIKDLAGNVLKQDAVVYFTSQNPIVDSFNFNGNDYLDLDASEEDGQEHGLITVNENSLNFSANVTLEEGITSYTVTILNETEETEKLNYQWGSNLDNFLIEGENTITVKVIAEGDKTWQETFIVHFDTLPPGVSTYPPNGGFINPDFNNPDINNPDNNHLSKVYVHIEDTSKISSAIINLVDPASPTPLETKKKTADVNDLDAYNNLSFDIAALEPKLEDGTYYLDYDITDDQGLQSIGQVSFTIDTIAPLIEAYTEDNNQYLKGIRVNDEAPVSYHDGIPRYMVTESNRVKVQGTFVEDHVQIMDLQSYYYNEKFKVTQSNGSSTGKFKKNLTYLKKGLNEYKVICWDKAGNNTEFEFQIFYDYTTPLYRKIRIPENKSHVSNYKPFTNLVDQGDLPDVIDPGTIVDESLVQKMLNSDGLEIGKSEWGEEFPEGQYTVVFEVEDESGQTTEDRSTFEVDSTSPVIQSLEIDKQSFDFQLKDFYTQSTKVTLRGQVSELNLDNSTLLDLDTGNAFKIKANRSGIFTTRCTIRPDGLNRLRLRFADKAGNETTMDFNLIQQPEIRVTQEDNIASAINLQEDAASFQRDLSKLFIDDNRKSTLGEVPVELIAITGDDIIDVTFENGLLIVQAKQNSTGSATLTFKGVSTSGSIITTIPVNIEAQADAPELLEASTEIYLNELQDINFNDYFQNLDGSQDQLIFSYEKKDLSSPIAVENFVDIKNAFMFFDYDSALEALQDDKIELVLKAKSGEAESTVDITVYGPLYLKNFIVTPSFPELTEGQDAVNVTIQLREAPTGTVSYNVSDLGENIGFDKDELTFDPSNTPQVLALTSLENNLVNPFSTAFLGLGDDHIIVKNIDNDLKFSSIVSGRGSINGLPTGAVFTEDHPFNLTAVPEAGYSFSHWVLKIGNTLSDAAGLTNSSLSFNLTDHTNLVAVFTPDQPQLLNSFPFISDDAQLYTHGESLVEFTFLMNRQGVDQSKFKIRKTYNNQSTVHDLVANAENDMLLHFSASALQPAGDYELTLFYIDDNQVEVDIASRNFTANTRDTSTSLQQSGDYGKNITLTTAPGNDIYYSIDGGELVGPGSDTVSINLDQSSHIVYYSSYLLDAESGKTLKGAIESTFLTVNSSEVPAPETLILANTQPGVDTSIKLQWNPNNSDDSDDFDYKVYRAVGNVGLSYLNSSSNDEVLPPKYLLHIPSLKQYLLNNELPLQDLTTYTDTQVIPGQQYHYAITRTLNGKESKVSNILTVEVDNNDSLQYSALEYEQKKTKALLWLYALQNPDGTWGNTKQEQLFYTAEIVNALGSNEIISLELYKALSALEAMHVHSVEDHVRKARALHAMGRDIKSMIFDLETQAIYENGVITGWGHNRFYASHSFHTSMALDFYANLLSTDYFIHPNDREDEDVLQQARTELQEEYDRKFTICLDKLRLLQDEKDGYSWTAESQRSPFLSSQVLNTLASWISTDDDHLEYELLEQLKKDWKWLNKALEQAFKKSKINNSANYVLWGQNDESFNSVRFFSELKYYGDMTEMETAVSCLLYSPNHSKFHNQIADRLLTKQLNNGSWDNDIYETLWGLKLIQHLAQGGK